MRVVEMTPIVATAFFGKLVPKSGCKDGGG